METEREREKEREGGREVCAEEALAAGGSPGDV
jgi:hypothetical protein